MRWPNGIASPAWVAAPRLSSRSRAARFGAAKSASGSSPFASARSLKTPRFRSPSGSPRSGCAQTRRTASRRASLPVTEGLVENGVVHAAPHPRGDADAIVRAQGFTGEVEADETYIGGAAHNPRGNIGARRTKGAPRANISEKAVVFGVVQRDPEGKTRVRAIKVPNSRRASLLPKLRDTVAFGATVLRLQTLRDRARREVRRGSRPYEPHRELLVVPRADASRRLHRGATVPPRRLLDEQVFGVQRTRGDRCRPFRQGAQRRGRQAADVRCALKIASAVAASTRSFVLVGRRFVALLWPGGLYSKVSIPCLNVADVGDAVVD